jgi:hypothetical protein
MIIFKEKYLKFVFFDLDGFYANNIHFVNFLKIYGIKKQSKKIFLFLMIRLDRKIQ